MSQVEIKTKASLNAGDADCFIFVGARHIECGVLLNKEWVQECFIKISIDVDISLQAVTNAIQKLEATLNEWRTKQSNSKKTAGLYIRVLVADTWLPSMSIPWTNALRQEKSAKVFAQGQLTAAGFTIEAIDIIKLDDAPYGSPRIVVAYPHALVAAFEKLARSLNGRLTLVQPLSAAAWRYAKNIDSKLEALAILGNNYLIFGYGSGRLNEVIVRANAYSAQAHPVSDSIIIQTLAEQWKRMRLRDMALSRVEKLSVLNLTLIDFSFEKLLSEYKSIGLPSLNSQDTATPYLRLARQIGSHCSALDAITVEPKMTPAKWSIAALVILGSLLLIAQGWERNINIRSIANKQIAEEKLRRPITVQRDLSKEEALKAQAFNIAIRELNLPISGLLRALQPPSDIQVAVLSIDTAGSGSSVEQVSNVKIIAEARTGIDMMRYVSFVAERRPFEGAYLTHHEIVESQPERPYRFSVEAKWAD